MSITEMTAEGLTVKSGGATVIRDFDLRAKGGTILGLTGPSASGKTTLLLALGGLAPAASGRLLLDGRPVVLWRDASVGLILQNLALVPLLSAQETVALPLQAKGVPRAEIAARSSAALGTLGLADHTAQLVGRLSGGQRQRVAIARALAAAPDVILADEPTSALDEHWRQVVLDLLLAEARRGALVILASTDPEVTTVCDELITLGQG
jgi:putative ABC transport system ATP-binding protein